MRIRLATHGGLQRCPDMNAAQLPVIWPFVLVQVSKRNANRPSLAVALNGVIASLLQRREARGDDFGIEGDGHCDSFSPASGTCCCCCAAPTAPEPIMPARPYFLRMSISLSSKTK